MRSIDGIRLIVMATVLVSWVSSSRAETDHDTADLDRSVAVFDKGDKPGALVMVEGVLAHSPDNLTALYRSAAINFAMNNVDAARGRLERLVKLSGNYFAAWELMVQVTQAQGDLARRNEAITRMKIAIRSALDPEIRGKADFIRDRIQMEAGVLSVVDYFERGGNDFTRYQISFGDPRMNPDKGLLLRTDTATTQTWADTALLPPDKQLFHLDLVDPRPEGGEKVAIYQYYVGEPDYDTVRANVMQILRGEVQPLSGEPGSLWGIMKR
jgi:hypothetical protein